MQGDTISYNLTHDTNSTYFVFCKPCNFPVINKADSLQLQNDSLSFKYFFDYSFKHPVSKSPSSYVVTRESIFTSHQLQLAHTKPIIRQEYSNDWIALLLLICFSLLAWILIFSHKRVKQIFKATYSNRTINQLIRDGDLFKERIAISFTFIYYLSFSLFVFQLCHYYFNLKLLGLYSLIFFLKLIVGITVLHILKQRATRLIGTIFKNNTASYVYQLNGFVFNIIIGIVLLPLLLFMVYSKGAICSFTIIFGIIFVVMLSLLRYIRYFIIGVSYSKFSQFYLFLYLCTLEILPILIIVKIIIGLIDSKMQIF
ncbi:MAG: DUF4271 domain-containing protein [Bacteroidetes bacterium]|nr:DUF4271 domain-containing protein [Bacteroidota bacterium]